VVLVAGQEVRRGQAEQEVPLAPDVADVGAEGGPDPDLLQPVAPGQLGGLGGVQPRQRAALVRPSLGHSRWTRSPPGATPRVSKNRRAALARASTSYSRWFCTRIVRSASATPASGSSTRVAASPIGPQEATCGSWYSTRAPLASRCLASGTAGDSRWSAMFGL